MGDQDKIKKITPYKYADRKRIPKIGDYNSKSQVFKGFNLWLEATKLINPELWESLNPEEQVALCLEFMGETTLGDRREKEFYISS